MPRVAIVTAFLVLAACGAREPLPGGGRPVDFSYRLPGARAEGLTALRGRPLVLVLLRISELTSELHLKQVVEAHGRVAGRTRFLVLSLEPAEEVLLGEYVEFNALPFPVGVAEWAVAAGESDLGRIPVTPTTYFIGPDGRVAAVAPGAMLAAQIEAELRRRRWL